MIGCGIHCVQHAVGKILELHEGLFKRFHELMLRLDPVKRRAVLKEEDVPIAVIRNATRWISTFAMIKRYFELKEFFDTSNERLLDVLFGPVEENNLKKLFKNLRSLERESKRLQADPDQD